MIFYNSHYLVAVTWSLGWRSLNGNQYVKSKDRNHVRKSAAAARPGRLWTASMTATSFDGRGSDVIDFSFEESDSDVIDFTFDDRAP